MSGIVWVFLFFCVACCTVCKLAALNVEARDKRGSGASDTATIQEIHRGLQKMDQRMEALETIIMDSHRFGREPEFSGSRYE